MLENPMVMGNELGKTIAICAQCTGDICEKEYFYKLENGKLIHKDCATEYVEEMKKFEAYQEWIDNNLEECW